MNARPWENVSERADDLICAFRDAQEINQAGFYVQREEERRRAYRDLAGYIAELEAARAQTVGAPSSTADDGDRGKDSTQADTHAPEKKED